jgi:hypothetical protein
MSQPTISRDIRYLEKGFAKSTKNYDKRLFSTFASTIMEYDEIDSKNTNDKEWIKAITIIGQYYRQKMELIKSEPELL